MTPPAAEPLPIDWSDVLDDPADDDRDVPEPRHRDIHGQGATCQELHTMTTVRLKGSYL